MSKDESNVLYPPSKIGIVGGGQLGKLMAFEAKKMGYHLTILDPTYNCPAGQVSDEQITASFADKDAIRKLAKETDVITFEFEHINADILKELEDEGYRVYPSGYTLKKIQNKYIQKKLLFDKGVKVPNLKKVNSKLDIINTFEDFGDELILKTCTGGYDGKGNIVIKNKAKLDEIIDELSDDSIKEHFFAEKLVDFEKELSIIASRDLMGNVSFYPIAENTHKDSILTLTVVPADISSLVEEKAINTAKEVMDILDDVGVFCIEMFLGKDHEIYVNEIAPRPHNSGHYTYEGCITSQFEQLIRIITGMPLGSTNILSPCAMVNILGTDEVKGKYSVKGMEDVLKEKNTHIHLYGKSSTGKNKKIGHITVLDETVNGASKKALEARSNLKIVGI